MARPSLTCPSCSVHLTADEVLEACSVSEAESGLLRLRCPRCGEMAFARLADGRLELGVARRDGEGAFRPSTVLAEPDLFVRREAAWVDCWYGRVYRRYPVAA
jgi:hypothetical protein